VHHGNASTPGQPAENSAGDLTRAGGPHERRSDQWEQCGKPPVAYPGGREAGALELPTGIPIKVTATGQTSPEWVEPGLRASQPGAWPRMHMLQYEQVTTRTQDAPQLTDGRRWVVDGAQHEAAEDGVDAVVRQGDGLRGSIDPTGRYGTGMQTPLAQSTHRGIRLQR
jgi:hypothetical protein